MKIAVKAPAKINLYLDVMPKRADGYHNIKSIMHTVSLCDTVTVDTTYSGISLSCSDPSLPTDEKNLAHRAAQRFFEKTGIAPGAKIHIEKNIPVAGGLAGGSTDAAATLKALNKAYGSPLSDGALCDIGATLGADVPFCVLGGCAYCTGNGEVLVPIPTLPQMYCVISNGGEGVSTPAAYRKIDEMYEDTLSDDFGKIEEILKAQNKGETEKVLSLAYNIFESVVLPTHSTASRLKEIMSEHGCTFTMMSGSGPSVFAFFESKKAAKNAALAAKEIGATAVVCTTTGDF